MSDRRSQHVPRKRVRFQFGLRMLGLFVVVAALAASWVAARIERTRRQQDAVQSLQALGGTVRYHHERTATGAVKQLAQESLTLSVLAEPNTRRVAPTERLVFAPRAVEPPLSAADKGLRDAMQLDPTFATGSGEGLRQDRAIEAWQAFLKRKDLTREQGVFAWWRIGSLAAYNFDATRGEVADMALAESAFLKVHQIARELISVETLNTATVYGTLPGKPTERAARFAEAYRWLFTRTTEMVNESAKRINHNGYLVDDRLMRGGMRLYTLSQKRKFLRTALVDRQETMNKRISEEIQYSSDSGAIDIILNKIRNVADPTLAKRWDAMLSDVRTPTVQSQPDQ